MSVPNDSSAAPRASPAWATRYPVLLDWALREDDTERMRPSSNATTCCSRPSAPCLRASRAVGGLGAVRTFLGLAQAYLFALEWNLTGQPFISVPVGRSDDGLPIGMQLVGRHGEEADCSRSPRSSRASCAGPIIGRLLKAASRPCASCASRTR